MAGRVLLELWTRLVCFASVTALFVVTATILLGIDGWMAYETGQQLCAEIGARVVIALGVAVVFATVAALLAAPYILWLPARARARCSAVTHLAALITFIVCASVAIGVAIRWSEAIGLVSLTNKKSIHLWAGLSGLLAVGTLSCYFLTRSGRATNWTTTFSESISGRTTRRLLLLAGVGSLLTGLSRQMDHRPSPVARRTPRTPSTGRNIVLVTFDALSAEDMSCYGYRLPTTPNIDALAHSSHVFTRYYAASTFTTPCTASMLTGRYPSGTRVFHFGGSLRGREAERTLAGVLREGGYFTAASVANPYAHPACLGFGNHFDVLPPPPLKDLATREATALFHSSQLAEDVRRGANLLPYTLEQLAPRTFGHVHSTFPPAASFAQAERILRDLPQPFFLWVHTLAPHFPYLPEPPYLRKFLPTDELRTHAEFADMMDLAGYTYSPARQPLVDKSRLRYNEWVAQADAAFGEFMATLSSSGRLRDTAVVVSADHGENFHGGFLGHGGPEQLLPIVHIPLIVHLPGQEGRQNVAAVVDQTALAPTILDIASLERPDWMDGRSLRPLMRGEDTSVAADNRAFTQYFLSNSAFKPIRHGTIGVIDGQHQYLFDLDADRGSLFDVTDGYTPRIDRSAADPQLASDLRQQIRRRFPEIFEGRTGST